MKLRFTPASLAERDEALAYVRARFPTGALNLAVRIRSGTAFPAQQPGLGRPTSGQRLRRITATPHRYHVFDEVTDAEIIVVAVRHAAHGPATMPGQP